MSPDQNNYHNIVLAILVLTPMDDRSESKVITFKAKAPVYGRLSTQIMIKMDVYI